MNRDEAVSHRVALLPIPDALDTNAERAADGLPGEW